MSFPRHQEIFPSDGGAGFAANAPAHRLDEFPAGYSLAGCAPAGPASASPTGSDYAVQSSCRASSFHRTANCVLTVCVSTRDKRTRTLRRQEIGEHESSRGIRWPMTQPTSPPQLSRCRYECGRRSFHAGTVHAGGDRSLLRLQSTQAPASRHRATRPVSLAQREARLFRRQPPDGRMVLPFAMWPGRISDHVRDGGGRQVLR